MAAKPCFVTPIKWCGQEAERQASTATAREPSVPFLNPTGNETPEASSRWSWDSVVRAPIAARERQSARNLVVVVLAKKRV